MKLSIILLMLAVVQAININSRLRTETVEGLDLEQEDGIFSFATLSQVLKGNTKRINFYGHDKKAKSDDDDGPDAFAIIFWIILIAVITISILMCCCGWCCCDCCNCKCCPGGEKREQERKEKEKMEMMEDKMA